ncbi:MAG: outer membrane protein assembly factor BamB family protein [Thermoplasmatota archaeon]
MRQLSSRFFVVSIVLVFAATALVPAARPQPICAVSAASQCVQLPQQADDVPPLDSGVLNADWPMYGHDLWGSHFNAVEGVINTQTVGGLALKWTFPIPGGIAGTAVVAKGIVYAAAWNGHVYAFDALTGKQLWATNLAEAMSATPAVAGGIVYVTTLYPGNLVALDAAHGTKLWEVPLDTIAEGWGSPIVAGGLVVVGQSGGDTGLSPPHRGSLQAFDAASGTLIWRTYSTPAGQGEAAIWTTPAVLGNLVFAGTGNDFSWGSAEGATAIEAFNLTTGGVVWVSHYPDYGDEDFAASPQLFFADGHLVLGEAQKEHYHVVDPLTGAVLWDRNLDPSWTIGTPAVAYGNVYGAFGEDSWWSAPPTMAFSVRDGTTLWSHPEPGSYSASAVAGGVAFMADIPGNLYGYDAMTGAQLWHTVVPGGTSSGIVVAAGHVYMGSAAGVSMYALA